MYAFSHSVKLPTDNSTVSYLSAMDIAFESDEEAYESADLPRVQTIGELFESQIEESKLAA
ncbi:MAG: hypothetical protein LBC09_00325 [Helicobacteraceae bacterium]|jgi:hypothetical protein|nr:hypothetical protein [Helicobacteraceae bacterium]